MASNVNGNGSRSILDTGSLVETRIPQSIKLLSTLRFAPGFTLANTTNRNLPNRSASRLSAILRFRH